jgi:hypothetical protein
VTDKTNRLDIEAAPLKTGADYTCFLFRFDPAEPVTHDQHDDTSDGRKPKVQRAQREKSPLSPQTDEMANHKPKKAQAKIQEQSPKTSIPYQMIYSTIEQRNNEGK